jgi:hypothetical protein
MRFPAKLLVHLAWGIVVGTPVARAQQSDFHATVEPDGKVVLCLAKGELLFADKCAGTGRLSIVQPIKEGPVNWRFATGTVTLENEGPECTRSQATWDTRTERSAPSGKRIDLVDPAAVLAQLDSRRPGQFDMKIPGREHLTEADVTAFALDLDNDGKDETVYVADNVPRISELNQKTQETYPYAISAGILREGSPYPATFYSDIGEYSGGTDAIGHVVFKGVIPIALGTKEIALLFRSHGMSGEQTLLRYKRGSMQVIQAIEFPCG